MTEEAKRDNKTKPALSMLPLTFKAAVARVMMFGATKYGRWNYLNGHKITGLVDSIERHLGAILEGEDVDPESGLSHWAHIGANALMATHQIQLGTLKDDRYKPAAATPQLIQGDAYVPMPVTVWQIMAKGRNGSALVVSTLIVKPSKEELDKAGRDWPSFTISVKEVTDDFGHKATA